MLGMLTTLRQPGPAPVLPELRLIPAKASIYDWQVLPGVGPVLAERLHTALHGRDRIDGQDLDDVHGAGPRRVASWTNLLVLGVQP